MSDTVTKTENYNRMVQIVLFFIISTLFFVSISTYSSYITPLANDLGITPTVIGVILGATGMVSMFVRFPIGILSQMFSRRKLVIQLGLLVTVIAFFIAFLAPNAVTLFIAKGVGGLTGATWVMYTVLFSTYFTAEEIPKSIGVINLASSIGPIIGASVGGFVSSLFSYKFSLLAAVVAAAITIILVFFLKEPKVGAAATPKDALHMAKLQLLDKNVWRIGIIDTIAMMATYAYMDYLTPTIVENLGGGAAEIAITANCFRVFCIISSPLTGTIIYKKLGVTPTIVIGTLGLALSCILMPLAPNLMMVYVLHCCIGFFFTMDCTMMLALIIMGVPHKYQTIRMGFLQSIYSIGLSIGPMLSGILTAHMSIRNCAFIMGGVVLILAIICKWLVPKGLDKVVVDE
ncbi:MFS transporter [Gallibacter sp. Marseille-QA0791]|uniref:MFS transporter n=1 Tax=Gallibacter sp. Marseille-QA0791 TaxID=3378781 RepID=UPI003D0DAEC5